MELPGRRELREQILHQMDGRTSYVSDADVYREIDKAILRSGHSGYGTLSEKEELRRQMFSSIRGFDVLEKYLEDSSISEIMVIGASHIFVEQNGRVRRTRDHFFEEADVYRLIEQIVAPTNRMVNEASPIVDSRLPDGSRVHIVLPPISLEGPVITIRKFLKGGMTIARLLAFGEFPEALTGILSALVKGKYNILISGATNSGKSSLLNALAEYIGQEERVITIEDAASQTAKVCAQKAVVQQPQNARGVFFSIYEGGSLCENLIDGGKRGISIHSTLLEGEQLQIKAAYTLKVPVPFFSGLRFRKKTTVKRRIFSGYVKHWGEYEEAGDNQIVYVAENGVVYHKDSSCSHICLKITGSAAIQEVLHSSKYAACEKCIKKGKNPSALFVTAYGDCYHSTLGCSGLKRTIKAVKLKDVGNMRPCSRCASGR